MFETVLGRLQALAQAEGFDPQPGTVIDGELRAYAAGIALVYDQLTDTRAGAFAATAAEENLWRWLTVRGLLPGDTLQGTRQKLLARRQMPGGFFFSGLSTGTQRSVRRGRNLSLHGRQSGTGDPCRRADQFGSPAAGLGAALSLCPFVGQRAHLECVGRRRGALCRL